MMKKASIALAAVIVAGCAQMPQTADMSGDHFARDRASILAMTGTYHVTFDMRETVSFASDYTLLPPEKSGGTEVVFVAEDTGNTIQLQHILVGTQKDGKVFLVKHWRQDWTYQPATVLEYQGFGAWTPAHPTKAQMQGAWSQTVWQVDDSPRYGGLGRWRYDGGVARWEGFDTARPLPRRDATRKPAVPFDRYVGMNRHTLTPDGWVHEQDNAKIVVKDGKAVTVAHEVVLNTYERANSRLTADVEKYWASTKDFWAAVRGKWDAVLLARGEIKLAENPEWGSVTAEALLTTADDIAEGKTTTAAAIASATTAIDANTTAKVQHASN